MTIKQKVGIIACSGENEIGGTLSRVAARIVVEKLRPENTVILCQPLFSSGGLERHGGEEEREFAKSHPTITVEGCEEECSKIAVENYSGPVTATIRVDKILKKYINLNLGTKEKLGEDGMKLAEIIAKEIAKKVDQLYESQ